MMISVTICLNSINASILLLINLASLLRLLEIRETVKCLKRFSLILCQRNT